MKTKKGLLVLYILTAICFRLNAQRDFIEIDTSTGVANKTLPYDKPFTLRMLIDADAVKNVYIIPKIKYLPLDGSIEKLIDRSPVGRGYKPLKLPPQYFYTKKINDKNYLYITFADTFLLKPSCEYFLIIDYKKLGASINSFFNNYYHYRHESNLAKRKEFYNMAKADLITYNNELELIYGKKLYFGTFPSASFNEMDSINTGFDADYIKNVDSAIAKYYLLANNNSATINSSDSALSKMNFNFDSLSFKILIKDTTINDDVIHFLNGKDEYYNSLASDFTYIQSKRRFSDILSGTIPLSCIGCTKTDITSIEIKDLQARITNIDSSIAAIDRLRKTFFLLRPLNSSMSNINTLITNLDSLKQFLSDAKSQIKSIVLQRKKIESITIDSSFAGSYFNLSAITQGNSLLTFATRNKGLLTPDFGVVTSAPFKSGKKFSYGIVPYLGFNINIMPVDKDLTFSTYKKDWKQHLSIMVGWSLVSMEQDSTYKNFFTNSSLLLGMGYRFNNVLRISAGTELLFKTGKDNSNNPTKKIAAIPYIGLSLDLDIKSYLNGFVDLLSGIGKTKPDIVTSTSTTTQ